MQIQLAGKACKNNIKRFYKNNRYSASFMGDDQCFYITHHEDIVACVIVSYTTTTPFLHGLVVQQNQQNNGLARQLVAKCQQQFNDIICFADNDLTEFYQKLGFVKSSADILPANLLDRFQVYSNKNSLLQCYQYNLENRN